MQLSLSAIRRVDVRPGPRLRQDNPVDGREAPGAHAERRRRGDILPHGQRVHALDVELPVQADLQADTAREGAALQHRRLQSEQGPHLQLQSTAAHVLQGAGRQEVSDHRASRLHLHRQGTLWIACAREAILAFSPRNR